MHTDALLSTYRVVSMEKNVCLSNFIDFEKIFVLCKMIESSICFEVYEQFFIGVTKRKKTKCMKKCAKFQFTLPIYLGLLNPIR